MERQHQHTLSQLDQNTLVLYSMTQILSDFFDFNFIIIGVNEEWNSFIKEKMSKWKTYINSVVFKSPPDLPKLVVHYEDFQKDRVREVSRVLDFLHFPYSHETLSQRLEEDFNSFHRNRHTEFEHYTQYQEKFVDHTLRKLIDRLSARNSGETYGIEDYLRNTEIAIQN